MVLLRGLVRACHPVPSVFVTAFTATFAAVAGLPPGRVAAVALAVLAGQLVIGWTNDAVDAPLDAAAGRRDKPVAAGAVSRRAVAVAACAAGVVAVAASLALGLLPGLLHLGVVASGLAYDLGLKRTPWSWLPYLVAFGLLPAVVTTAAPGVPVAPLAVMASCGLLGVAAHFANTVADAEADAATGVRGLPQLLGPDRSLLATAVLVALVAGLLLGAGARTPVGAGLLVAGVVVAGAGAVLPRRARGERSPWPFRLALVAVALVLVGFLAAA